MKKILCIIVIALMALSAVFAQNSVTLTFEGQTTDGSYRRLDSIVIENISRNWMETIYYPDTVYTLKVGVGVSNLSKGNGMLVMPNPFDGTTRVNIQSSSTEKVKMRLADINGRVCAEFEGVLREGDNMFNIAITIPQTYVLSVQTASGIRSLKMENTGRASANRITYGGSDGNFLPMVQLKSSSTHAFQLGDEMKYLGYSGDLVSSPVTKSQLVSEEIVLAFEIPERPCPPTVTDYDGNVYNTVILGSQCWTKENLRSLHYANGNPISTTGYYYPNNDTTLFFPFGLLYVWNTVMNNAASSEANPSGVQGICPDGWHVPSIAEWQQLQNYVNNCNDCLCFDTLNYRHTAKAMGLSARWKSSSNLCSVGDNQSENNSTGFSAAPAGFFMLSTGYPEAAFSSAYFSSTTSSTNNTPPRVSSIVFNYPNGDWEYGFPIYSLRTSAFSVRCVYDDSIYLAPTTQLLPQVTIYSITEASSRTYSCGGNVTSDGGAPVTGKGVCWSTSHNPTIADAHSSDGVGLGSFSSDMTGLMPVTRYYVRAYATNSVGTAYSTEFNVLTSPEQDGQPCPQIPTVADYDGNVYNTVQIGSQCWMKENLRTVHSADGSDVSHLFPNNDSANVSFYGRLYNWYAAMYHSTSIETLSQRAQGICPTGWHLPSDSEWIQLQNYINTYEAYRCNNVPDYLAKSLADTMGWIESTASCTIGFEREDNNITGFSARPAGYYNGSYNSFGSYLGMWSSRENPQTPALAVQYVLGSDNTVMRNSSLNKNRYFSVRCVYGNAMPTVLTDSIVSLLDTMAIIQGTILMDGGEPLTARGICWSTTPNPTVASNHTNNGVTIGGFNGIVRGLNPATQYYARVYATNPWGTAYGSEISFITPSYSDGQPCANNAFVMDVDSNMYNTVSIGSQCWMKENLRTTRYADGTAIPLGSTTSSSSPYRYCPNGDSTKVYKFGYLYNRTAFMGGTPSNTPDTIVVQGICPNGWHVPTEREWVQLESYVITQPQYLCGNSASNPNLAKSLAAADSSWNSSSSYCGVGNNVNLNNATGFSALPSGIFNENSSYYGFGNNMYFWVRPITGVNVSAHHFSYNNASVSDDSGYSQRGYSIRCLKD